MVEEEKLEPVKNKNWVKPEGGLWTSSYDPECGSGWIQWSIAERFSGEWNEEEEKGYYGCYLLHPEPARVLVIDTQQDLIEALRHYQNYDHRGGGWGGTNLDFEALAEDYDAIHLTDRGQWATRMTNPGLYGWDCESTLWFRWCFYDVEWLGNLGFPYCDELEIEKIKLKALGLRRNPYWL